MTKHEAIYKLYTNVVTIHGDNAFDLQGEAIVYDESAVQAEMQANAYSEKRAREYPSIVDQLDTLYHGGYDAWRSSIETVKQQFPKPE